MTTIDIKELNRKIDRLGVRLANGENDIQSLGLACLEHGMAEKDGGKGDVTPLNRLFNVLRKGQHKAFMEWCLAFGNVAKNVDKKARDALPMVYVKDRVTDLKGATEKPWHMFADEKAEASAKAFDFQAAVMALLKRASSQGIDHDKLVAVASVAGISADKVPPTVITGAQIDAVEAATLNVGVAIV